MKQFIALLLCCFLVNATAKTAAQRIEAKEDTLILLVGDSLTGEGKEMYPYRVAELLAAKNPEAKVVFMSRGQGTAQTTDTVLQAGSGGYTISVIRDGTPGATSYRVKQVSTIYSLPVHLTSIFLGVNDAVNFGLSPKYTPKTYNTNITRMAKYAQATGAEVALITPAWSEAEPRIEIAGVAWLSRRLARINGWVLLDARALFEANYSGTGNGGQGAWFERPKDHTHFTKAGHDAIAAEFMRVNGL